MAAGRAGVLDDWTNGLTAFAVMALINSDVPSNLRLFRKVELSAKPPAPVTHKCLRDISGG